ncbi:GerAB/ArcD/ProY family transporter [Neobittarella massiliensis]|uniref:GerAB/ArcD/ProY family transporter n=1 Tax=Neobittarella massiliensis (ex Bilen et al. 2018) TaxID=2041842 RepID=A0A8J6LYQ0_9FIRM|nr:GerAB/ArcD/ProY family transporter [Neobittarella massiliensis]
MRQGKQYISQNQLVLLLFLSNLFSYLTYYTPKGAKVGFGSSIVGLVLGNLAALGIGMLYFAIRGRLGHNLGEFLLEQNRVVGIVFSWLAAVFLGLAAVHSVCGFTSFIHRQIYTQTNYLVFLLPFLGVALFGLLVGIESLARTGTLIFALTAVSLAIVLLGTLPNIDPPSLYSYSSVNLGDTATAFWGALRGNIDLLVALLLMQHQEKKSSRVFKKYFFLSTGTAVGLSLLVHLALGPYAATRNYPFYALAVFSDLSVLQRLDSFYLVVWVMVSFVRVVLLLTAMASVLQTAVPQRAYKKTAIVFLAVVTAAAIIGCSSQRIYDLISLLFKSGYPSLLLVLLPVCYLLATVKRRRGER